MLSTSTSCKLVFNMIKKSIRSTFKTFSYKDNKFIFLTFLIHCLSSQSVVRLASCETSRLKYQEAQPYEKTSNSVNQNYGSLVASSRQIELKGDASERLHSLINDNYYAQLEAQLVSGRENDKWQGAPSREMIDPVEREAKLKSEPSPSSKSVASKQEQEEKNQGQERGESTRARESSRGLAVSDSPDLGASSYYNADAVDSQLDARATGQIQVARLTRIKKSSGEDSDSEPKIEISAGSSNQDSGEEVKLADFGADSSGCPFRSGPSVAASDEQDRDGAESRASPQTETADPKQDQQQDEKDMQESEVDQVKIKSTAASGKTTKTSSSEHRRIRVKFVKLANGTFVPLKTIKCRSERDKYQAYEEFKHSSCARCYGIIPAKFKSPVITATRGPCLFDEEFQVNVSTEDTRFVRTHFNKEFHYQLWLDCCFEAAKCCIQNAHSLSEKTNELGELVDDAQKAQAVCPATWDGLACWPDSPVGRQISYPCPDHIYYVNQKPDCQEERTKDCLANGTWMRKNNIEWSDFHRCTGIDRYQRRFIFAIGWYFVDALVIIPALLVLKKMPDRRGNRRIRIIKTILFWLLLQNFLNMAEKYGMLVGVFESNSVQLNEPNNKTISRPDGMDSQEYNIESIAVGQASNNKTPSLSAQVVPRLEKRSFAKLVDHLNGFEKSEFDRFADQIQLGLQFEPNGISKTMSRLEHSRDESSATPDLTRQDSGAMQTNWQVDLADPSSKGTRITSRGFLRKQTNRADDSSLVPAELVLHNKLIMEDEGFDVQVTVRDAEEAASDNFGAARFVDSQEGDSVAESLISSSDYDNQEVDVPPDGLRARGDNELRDERQIVGESVRRRHEDKSHLSQFEPNNPYQPNVKVVGVNLNGAEFPKFEPTTKPADRTQTMQNHRDDVDDNVRYDANYGIPSMILRRKRHFAREKADSVAPEPAQTTTQATTANSDGKTLTDSSAMIKYLCWVTQVTKRIVRVICYGWEFTGAVYLCGLLIFAPADPPDRLIKWLIIIINTFPIVSGFIYVIVRSYYEPSPLQLLLIPYFSMTGNENKLAELRSAHYDCWILTSSRYYIEEILHLPNLIFCCLNFFLFATTLVIMCRISKPGSSRPEMSLQNYFKAAGTLVMLYGCHYAMVLYQPEEESCVGSEIRKYLLVILDGFQGVMVSYVFCFGTPEGKEIMKKWWKQTRIRIVARLTCQDVVETRPRGYSRSSSNAHHRLNGFRKSSGFSDSVEGKEVTIELSQNE